METTGFAAAHSSITTTTAGLTSSWSTEHASRQTGRLSDAHRVSRLYIRITATARFTDVTARGPVLWARTGWGQGCCVGDYNNDGHDDLFVSYWGDCALWRNDGNGKFTNVAAKAGVTTDPGNGQRRWNTGCAFLDYDKDGHLDLFVANYIEFDPKTTPLPESDPCLFKGIMVACGPPGLQGGKNILFHNNGDGTFKDV